MKENVDPGLQGLHISLQITRLGLWDMVYGTHTAHSHFQRREANLLSLMVRVNYLLLVLQAIWEKRET